jgi:hypothetical protein
VRGAKAETDADRERRSNRKTFMALGNSRW